MAQACGYGNGKGGVVGGERGGGSVGRLDYLSCLHQLKMEGIGGSYQEQSDTTRILLQG